MTSRDEDRIDPAQVSQWYHQHGGRLRSFLLGVVRDPELADELVQVTFTRAMEAGHTARSETLKGWLFRVAYNEAMLAGRKRQIHNRSLQKIAGHLPPETDTPEDLVSLDESIQTVREAVEQLSPEQQAVVRRRIYQDKTFAVIAEELETPLGTVLTRMRSALAVLRRQLADRDRDEVDR